MLLLRIIASLLFHLPIVLCIPHHTTTSLSSSSSSSSPRHHHHRYNRSLEAFVVVAPLPPPPPPPPPPTTTTIVEPIPFPLPPTTSFPLPPSPPPTTTSDPWKDMCLPGQECDCSRIKDKNGEDTDYRTLLPGTYTTSSSAHGTAHVVVVQQPASIHFVTLTVTREVRVTPLCEAVGSGA
ncbi:hypothetical protein V8C26DRAFT_431385 [Trichoderma gracile]